MPMTPPGLLPRRLLTLISRSVSAMALDLQGANVVTEAATGAYTVTPVLAALAGASHVTAMTRPSRYGTLEDVATETHELAELGGVADRIQIVDSLTPELVGAADIVTNSGHVRPIDELFVSWMRPDCVVPLMFESWEIDAGRIDVDLDALRRRGIRFAGTNERHSAVGVFDYLGPMAVKLLSDAKISAFGATVLVLCDNPFETYLADGLTRSGAAVTPAKALRLEDLSNDLDAIIVAMTPRDGDVFDEADVALVARRAPCATIAQFWGDMSRSACDRLGVAYAPTADPGAGHMGVLPSAVGPEPIVRLQAGGLKVATILRRPEREWTVDDRRYVDEC